MALHELRKTIGPYEVRDVIGHGGMATVYQAYDTVLERVVAIKVLQPAFVHDSGFRFRFEREARLVARLRHRHIVGIFNVGEDDGMPYLVMEYLQGPTLHKDLRRRAQSGELYTPAEALELLKPIAGALDYAHAQGIIHRDLKPENIILTPDGPVITDFGLAKLVQEEVATVSVVMGTPSYMAPEQIQAQLVDRRTDVYALGILLFEMLTGQPPFVAPTPFAVAQAHLSQTPPALASRQPHLAALPLVDEVLRKAIAKQKVDRWPSAGAMVSAFERAISSAPHETGRHVVAQRVPMMAETAGARPSPPPIVPPARLRRPSTTEGKLGRLVVLLPLAAMLFAIVWAAALWGPHLMSLPDSTPAGSRADDDRAAAVVATELAGENTAVATAPSVPASISTPPTAQPSAQAPANQGAMRGVVRAPAGAYVRNGPGMGYAPVAGLLSGAGFTALGRANGWVQIVADTGEQGWIASTVIAMETGDVSALPVGAVPPLPTTRAVVPATPRQAAGVSDSPPTAAGAAIRLEDTNFGGGWRNRGGSVYGGRTATWAYGQGSGFSQMSATFSYVGRSGGTATLTLEGMDSEDARKTPIRIALNGVTLFENASPFPNDDRPLQSGRWSAITLPFDAAILRQGANTVTIVNLAPGSKGLPPFVAVDYAVVRLP